MGKLGLLGDIIFEVSSDKIQTFNNFKYSGNASYSTHSTVNRKGIIEFTGADPDECSLDIEVYRETGGNPDAVIKKVNHHMLAGNLLLLIIGNKRYGYYRWVISGYTVNAQYFDALGNLTGAKISLKLKEYTKG